MDSTLRLFAVLALVAGCASTRSSTSSGPDDWLEASPTLQQQIDRRAQQLPWEHKLEERVELIRWFAGVGEPAYPTLLRLAEDRRPLVAGAALAALGATRDARLVPHLQGLRWPEDADRTIVLEHARALAMLGDWSRARVLIDALRSEDLYLRAVAARTLSDLTGERFGFEAKGPAAEREAAVERWEAWWETSRQRPTE